MLALVNAFVALVPAREAELAHLGRALVVGLAKGARDQFLDRLAAERALGERLSAHPLKDFKRVVAELALGLHVLVFVNRHGLTIMDKRKTQRGRATQQLNGAGIFRIYRN